MASSRARRAPSACRTALSAAAAAPFTAGGGAERVAPPPAAAGGAAAGAAAPLARFCAGSGEAEGVVVRAAGEAHAAGGA